MGYKVLDEMDGMRDYVDGTLMNLARLDAWFRCVSKALDTNASRERRGQLLFSMLYGNYVQHAVHNLFGEP